MSFISLLKQRKKLNDLFLVLALARLALGLPGNYLSLFPSLPSFLSFFPFYFHAKQQTYRQDKNERASPSKP